MKRQLFYISIIMLLFAFQLKAQNFYTIQSDGTIAVSDISTCKSSIASKIVLSNQQDYFGDFTFTKDGKLYGVTVLGKIYEINVNTGLPVELININALGCNSMVSDANGIIYIADGDGNLFLYDVSKNTITKLGTMPFGAAGDLIFYKGQLYMASVNNKLIEVNIKTPSQSKIYMDFDSSIIIYGIVSLSPTCDNIKAYAIAENSKVYEIDFITRKLTFVCQLKVNGIYGAASQQEFNAAAAINISDLSITNADCGKNNGVINITATSGSGMLKYSIDGINYQTQSQFANLKNGIYTIQILGDKGCNADTTVTLQGAGEPIIKSTMIPNGCGASDKGMIEVIAKATDGSSIVYTLNNQATGNQASSNNGRFEDLSSGSYTVDVKTSKGCIITIPFELRTLPIPIINDIQITNTTCGLANGSLKITSNNSQEANHKYSLDKTKYFSKNEFTQLKAGTYTIYLKDSAECTAQRTVKIEGSNTLKINDILITNTVCGNNNGKVTVDVAWANGNKSNLLYQLDALTPISSNTFDNLAPKTYQLIVSSTNAVCKDTATFTIEPSIPIRIEKIVSKDAACDDNNGQISIQAKGNGTVFYQLGNGNFQTDNIFKQLTKGSYKFTIRDTQFCTITTPDILLSQNCFIFIPNSFSPNGDGINDTFTIFGKDEIVKKVKVFRVFNRWGVLVFEANDFPINNPELGWNGKFKDIDANAGVYTYYAEIAFTNLTTSILRGDVNLIK